MKYFEITLKNQNPLVCLEEQGEKKPMVKACVGKEILKGACVLGRRSDVKTEAGACIDWFGKMDNPNIVQFMNEAGYRAYFLFGFARKSGLGH